MLQKLIFGIALGVCVAACAHTPAAPAQAKATSTPPPGCVYPGTATRLPQSPSGCAAFGHSWTQDDLKRTGVGAIDAAQGLQMLDPTVTAHH